MAQKKNPAAVALGRLGGLAGKGKAAPGRGLAQLSPEQRSDIARQGAAKRWGSKKTGKAKEGKK